MSETRIPLRLVAGGWWRFSTYELKGDYIQPTKHAHLTPYDPWTERDSSPSSPYESLARLVGQGRRDLAYQMTPDTEAHLLSWCQSYGLLGVLLQRVDKVVLPARSEAHGTKYFCVQDRHLWTARGWQLARTEKACDGVGMADGELPGVSLHPLDSLEAAFEPLQQTWADFFPTIPLDGHESYQYPRPTSDEFWSLYREPVREFLDAATLLEQALTTLAKGRGTFADGERSKTPSAVDDYGLAINDLNSYASTVRWCLEPELNKFVQRWKSPSLFSSLAMMVLQDISGGQVPRACPTCGGIFVSAAYQATYCSQRCRQTMNKRTVRKNARARLQQRPKRGYKGQAASNRGHDD